MAYRCSSGLTGGSTDGRCGTWPRLCSPSCRGVPWHAGPCEMRCIHMAVLCLFPSESVPLQDLQGGYRCRPSPSFSSYGTPLKSSRLCLINRTSSCGRHLSQAVTPPPRRTDASSLGPPRLSWPSAFGSPGRRCGAKYSYG